MLNLKRIQASKTAWDMLIMYNYPFISYKCKKKLQKWLLKVPFHDGEVELIKYFKDIYQKGLQTRDWNTLKTTILDDFLNFKIICFPRVFLDFKHPLDLSIRLVNQDEYINKKARQIVRE